MKFLRLFLFALAFAAPAHAQIGVVSNPDPFILNDGFIAFQGGPPLMARNTTGLTPRSQIINPAQRTLVLITAGQSQWVNIGPTFYNPTNGAAIDNFNIYDGASYNILGHLVGCGDTFNAGNLGVRVADLLITNGQFNRVIIAPIAVSTTIMSDWTTGNLSNRFAVLMARLASRGIVPGMTGVTFAMIWGQGESDLSNGTSQAAWQAGFATIKANLTNAGFVGRIFVVEETWISGSVSATIQAAQAAVVDNVTVFFGGNMDSLNASNRQGDNTHLNDAGQIAMAPLTYNAMHASGAPF